MRKRLNAKQRRYTCKIVNESGKAILAIVHDRDPERIPVKEANRFLVGAEAGATSAGAPFERSNEAEYELHYPESQHDNIRHVRPHNYFKTIVDHDVISIRILFRRAANEYSDLGEGRYDISKNHVYVRQEAYSDELPVVQVSYDDGNPVIRSLPVRPVITFFGVRLG